MRQRPDLTNRQAEVLNFMISYFKEEHQLPSSRAITEHFSFSSQTGAMGHIQALHRKRYITKNDAGKYKFVLPIQRHDIDTIFGPCPSNPDPGT